mmetsp:Transcript_40032/g.52696  ORF Transcript_40032/g.52696 Transcript_40032/m.52696 type:complete len:99 (+) Transcript_40032:188-484(+)
MVEKTREQKKKEKKEQRIKRKQELERQKKRKQAENEFKKWAKMYKQQRYFSKRTGKYEKRPGSAPPRSREGAHNDFYSQHTSVEDDVSSPYNNLYTPT